MMILYYFLGFLIVGILIFVFAFSTAPHMDENGNLLDKDGNIVDERGRIIKSIEEIKKEFAEELRKSLEKQKNG
jgi:hypothetical protein